MKYLIIVQKNDGEGNVIKNESFMTQCNNMAEAIDVTNMKYMGCFYRIISITLMF